MEIVGVTSTEMIFLLHLYIWKLNEKITSVGAWIVWDYWCMTGWCHLLLPLIRI